MNYKEKSDFSYIKAFTGDSETYHNEQVFEGYGVLCELYIQAKDKQIKQDQVDKFNEFKANFKNFLPEIDRYILGSLRNSEMSLIDTINQAKLSFDIIEIPFENY